MNNLTEFFRQASFYRYHEDFDKNERLYKICLESAFSDSRSLMRSNPKESLRLFRRAFLSRDNNIIDWRIHEYILDWIDHGPNGFIEAVEELWDEKRALNTRFVSFCDCLTDRGVRKPGDQLAVTSTFLMTLSANLYPPVKTESFRTATRLAGWEGFEYKLKPVQRYESAVRFMDELVRLAPRFDVEFRDRLDAQGAIWCIYGGWSKVPVPDWWQNTPEQRLRQQERNYNLNFDEFEGSDDQLTSTQKLALVKMRQGQDKFREKLVRLWRSCSVTCCSDLTFLRASHIKPWKISDDRERLDPFNGLLLSPNLDIAFDRGLITFEDNGRILISPQFSASNRKLLGIKPSLRLRDVDPKHRPYLQYHRDEKFQKKK